MKSSVSNEFSPCASLGSLRWFCKLVWIKYHKSIVIIVIFLYLFSLDNWKIASRVAVVTVNGGIGGGFAAILLSAAQKKRQEYLLDIPQFVTGILGGLVGITAGSNVFRPWEGIVVGFIGGLAATGGILSICHCS